MVHKISDFLSLSQVKLITLLLAVHFFIFFLMKMSAGGGAARI